ncbi:MAG: LolA family protein [Phycisphaerales bacterium]|jgi:hypothetical protein
MILSTCISIVLSAGVPVAPPATPGEIDPGCGQPPTGSAGAAVPPAFGVESRHEMFDAEALLDRLERAGAQMRRFEAALTLIRFDALLEESETRLGSVLLVRDDADATRVAVVFDEFIDGAGHGEERRQHWVYADGWLDEIDHHQKRYIRRQLVMPGEDFDPLRIGEGPVPLPIAQRKADVLANFDVVEPPPPTPPMLDRLENFVALRLLPRPGTALAEDTAHIDLFYDKESLAPLGIRVLDRNGDRDTVMLRRPKVNAEFGETQQTLLLLEAPDPAEFEYDVRPLRRTTGSEETPTLE